MTNYDMSQWLANQDPRLAEIVHGNTAFALDLYAQLKCIEGNRVCSPYSISTALAMTYAGARGNTERQMAQTLHFTLDRARLHPAFAALRAAMDTVRARDNVVLAIANSLWPQAGYPFLQAFLSLVETYYGTSITPVDYGDPEAVRLRINGWVTEATEGKIQDLIEPGILDTLTRLVLVNAIHFKGKWANQFDTARTEYAPFWAGPEHQVDVPMMAQQERFGYAEHDGLQILELPYVGGDLSMIVLLPVDAGGLSALERALTVENLAKWTSDLRSRAVQVYLPRFQFQFGLDLCTALSAMGMPDASDEVKADFSGMDGTHQWLYVKAVIHQAVIEVNEEGSEAAAATAVVMTLRGLPPPPPVFRADHPFVFVIRENRTESILFLGRVVDPSGPGS